ncbi:SVSP family protein [Theileria parva strain Muguga]|uniref:Uncharacterized protein n=1 Tax=Theileria parva TaxID=5875 RepID=Q4N2E3_THEPA|nr:SVSP family protein [Theileria parva strain Muguga]EAN31758.1 SVSP family protein [Theileria parva strain Muguga]|eukprot:XP_764041.1 hypothetical protein [Theileria parva strain Muguga]
MSGINLYILIVILIVYVRCADKQGDKNLSLVAYSDSEEEENFEVTETTGETSELPDDTKPQDAPGTPKTPEHAAEKDVKQPVKPYDKPLRKCETIQFFKKGTEGNLVLMTGADYVKIVKYRKEEKYEFKVDLELVVCDGVTAYEHRPGRPYCSKLIHNKIDNVLTIIREGSILRMTFDRGKWRASSRSKPAQVELFTKDSRGNYKLITSHHYTVETNETGGSAYIFMPGVKCRKIIINKLLVWKKTDEKEYPTKFFVTIRLDVFLFFREYKLLFKKSGQKYRQITRHK